MQTFSNTLDSVMELSYNQQQMLVEIVNKRLIEEDRNQIAEFAVEMKSAYQRGELKSKPLNKILQELND